MDFVGTSARENFVGTVDPDTFDMSTGGRDTVSGLEGDDVISFGAELNDNDQIDGGEGIDEVHLEGNYFGGVVFTATTMVNVEKLFLAAGYNYTLTLDDATAYGPGMFDQFYVYADDLGAGEDLVLDASAETGTIIEVATGGGDDLVTLGFRGILRLHGAGDDTITGGPGTDNFFTYGFFDLNDRLDGGGGSDLISIGGDTSAGLEVTGEMLANFERMYVEAGNDHVIIRDEVAAAGITFEVDVQASVFNAGQFVIVDASAETDAAYSMTGAESDDTLIGGAVADIVDFAATLGTTQGGVDAAFGNDGDDTILFDGSFTADDQASGGDGFDTLELDGDLSAEINFTATTMTGIELVLLAAGHSYSLTLDTANVGADGFRVDGAALLAADFLAYDGTGETSDVIVEGGAGADIITTGRGDDSLAGNAGADILTGGRGDDTLSGANGQDTLFGGLGRDHITGGGHANTHVYSGVNQSTGAARDWVGVIKPLKDHFDMDVAVAAVDARVTSGAMSEASFDADLAAAVGAGQLGAGHAVAFKPNGGDLSGHWFLIVDANAVAGYQAGADYVMEFADGSHPANLAAGFFI